MNLDKLFLLIYVVSPFLAAVLPWPKNLRGGLITLGSGASILRILMLCALVGKVVMAGSKITLSGTLVNGYPLDIVLSLDAYRFGFLFTAELCFLLAHWMSAPTAPHGTLIRRLIGLSQGFCSLFIVSENAVATGALQILAGVIFFYIVRFCLEGSKTDLGISVSRRMYSLYFILGLMMMIWGIMEFASKDLLFSRVVESNSGILIWLVMVVASVPIPPWSRWFEQMVEFLPEGVTLAIVTFVSGVTLKFATLFSVVYPDLQWKQKLAIYLLGILGCGFSLGGVFAAKSRKRMLGSLPSFFLSLILVSVGVSKSSLVLSAYFICLFVPVFTGLILYASSIRGSGKMQKTFVGFFLAIVMGLPGTPVYLIFSGIGARSLDLGVPYTLVFGLLWFLYLGSNVYICRRIFMDENPPEPTHASSLEMGPVSFAAYGLFLMAFLILVTQAAWRIL